MSLEICAETFASSIILQNCREIYNQQGIDGLSVSVQGSLRSFAYIGYRVNVVLGIIIKFILIIEKF